MDIFDQGEQTAVPIDNLVTSAPIQGPTAPQASVKTQAAKTAMVATPTDVQGSYNQMVGEAAQGQSTTADMLNGKIKQAVAQNDQASLLSIMSDPNVPLDKKQAAIANWNKQPAVQDSSTVLQNGFQAAPVKGETPTAEDARISTVDALGEMYDSRQQIQNMTNTLHQATGSPSLWGQFLNHAIDLFPSHGAVQQNKTLNDLAQATGIDRQWWENISSIWRSGSQMQEARDMINALPPEKKLAVAKQMYQSVQAHSGFVFGSDNQADAYKQFSQLFSADQSGGLMQGVDNALGSLDFVFAGGMAKDAATIGKNAVGMARGVSSPLSEAEIATFNRLNPNGVPVKAEPTGTPSGVVSDVAEPGYSAPRTVAQDEPQAGGAFQSAMDRANAPAGNTTPISGGSALTGGSGVNMTQVGTKKTAALFTNPESIKETMNRLKQGSVTHDIQPNTSMEIAQNSNPDVARSMHEAIQNGTDEVAEALAGVPKDQAIANNTLPQVSNTGTVFSRTADIARNAREDAIDPTMVGVENNIGANALTPEEWSNVMHKVSNDFGNAVGMRLNDAMSSFSHEGDKIIIRGVYENPAGSWNSPEQAMEQAKVALREYGVLDSDITLLKKQGINHVPVSVEEARGLNGDYKVGVSINPEFSGGFFNDIKQAAEGRSPWSNLDVKRNQTDMFAGTQWGNRSSMARYMFDAQSMLHKTITNSASVGVDYAAKLERNLTSQLNDFATAMRGHGEARRAKINDYLQEANFNRIDFDQTDLAARGFSDPEIGTIRQFRDFQDRLYSLENLDVVRSMRNAGFQLLDHPNVRGYVRPLSQGSTVRRVYDPSTDTIRTLSKTEFDDLYTQGGNIGQFRNTMNLAGEDIDHVMIRQTGNEYSRALRDGDRILNKLPGYYHISYKSAKFIDEVDEGGRKIRTVAVSGDTASAQQFVNRMKANNPNTRYAIRNDVKGSMNNNNSDELWDLNRTRGRVNQRYRGQLLEGSDVPNHLGQATYIENPAKASENAAKSIANRTAMRNVIDTAQARFLDQYAEVLPKDSFGRVVFPESAADIGKLGDGMTKQAADARTTYEYINYLRNGYVNSVNAVSKAVLNKMAEVAAGKGLSGAERAFGNLAEKKITSIVKGSVFGAYLALNPLRQMVIQPLQAIRALAVYNPAGAPRSLIDVTQALMHFKLGTKATDFTDFVDKSGLVEAIKHHNMANGALMSIADNESAGGAVLKKSLDTARTIGFDNGELINIMSHAASVFNKYKSAGKNVRDINVIQEMHAETRNLSYALNRAGDMPYNQGSASMILQFMHMPHKALLNYTNRGLDPAVRARMLIGDAILYGVPMSSMIQQFNMDPLDGKPDARQLVERGIQDVLFNKMLEYISPGTQEKDFSTLRPMDLSGWAKMFQSLTHDGLTSAMANAPAASLAGNKIGQVFKDMGGFFMPQEYDKRNVKERTLGLLNDVAQLSSGYSNAEKAYIMNQLGERRDQYGQTLNSDPTFADTALQVFGFNDLNDQRMFDLQQDELHNKQDFRRDVLNKYRNVKKFYAEQYNTNKDPDMKRMQEVAQASLAQYANNAEALNIIQKQWAQDMMGTDQHLMMNMMRSLNIPGTNYYRDQIDNGPWDDATKKQMHQYLDFAQSAQAETDELTGKN